MSNISKEKRDQMISFLAKLRKNNEDDEVLKEIDKIENALIEKKYGLVWEEHLEKVDKELESKIPVFREIKEKELKIKDKNEYNFLLEGDNLHSLYLLEKTHKGKIDVIYIDPPYNTGNNDFMYDDEFVDKEDSYIHSKWISFMDKRLRIAQKLLSENGFICISIDDNEQANLKLLCDDIFGPENFVNSIAVKMSEPTGVKMKHVDKRLPKLKETILLYKKNKLHLNDIRIPKEKWDKEYNILVKGVNKKELEKLKNIMSKDNPKEEDIIEGDSICSKMQLGNINELYEKSLTKKEKEEINYKNAYRILRDVSTSGTAKLIADKKKSKVSGDTFLILTPRKKVYLMKREYNDKAKQPRSKLIFADQYLTKNVGDFWDDIKTTGLGDEGGVDFKNGKKPIKLIERIINLHTEKNITVLDFFAGSGSTGHAVQSINKKDGGNRKFILCTNNENNICEKITYKRMQNITEDYNFNLKYYKTDFIDRYVNEDTYISDELMSYIKEMIQLEYHIDLDNKEYIFINNEDEIEHVFDYNGEIEDCKVIFKPSYIFFNTSQTDTIKKNNIKIISIPEYYFAEELKEGGEL